MDKINSSSELRHNIYYILRGKNIYKVSCLEDIKINTIFCYIYNEFRKYKLYLIVCKKNETHFDLLLKEEIGLFITKELLHAKMKSLK